MNETTEQDRIRDSARGPSCFCLWMSAEMLIKADGLETDYHKDVKPGCRMVGNVTAQNYTRVLWPGRGKGV